MTSECANWTAGQSPSRYYLVERCQLTALEILTILTHKSEIDDVRLFIQTIVGGEQHILAGAASGRKLLAALIDATPSWDMPERVFLDFADIEVATVSFLRESVIGYRDFIRSSHQNIYPVIANANPAVLEELELLLSARADALWCCRLDDQGQPVDHRIIGGLDPAQRGTFESVRELGSASAPELAARFSDQNIGTTAWNNRLSGLAAKGLLLETRHGKTKVFRPLLENS